MTNLSVAGRLPQYLQWVNVSLIADCQRFYKDTFKPGMICAGRHAHILISLCLCLCKEPI